MSKNKVQFQSDYSLNSRNFYLYSWILIGILSFLLIIIIYVKLYRIYPMGKNIDETAVVDLNCNLHKDACTTFLSEKRTITFSMLPREIPLLKPLKLEVQLKNIAAEAVRVEITGINLDMGHFRTLLKKTGDLFYKGITSLPVCSKKIMKWQAMVLIKTKDKIILAPFHFETTYTPTYIILE